MNAPARSVAVDTTVLVNLCHVQRLDLLEKLTGYCFVVPTEAAGELASAEQRVQVDALLARGAVTSTSVVDVAELTVFADLHVTLGLGESACIAIAEIRGWLVACDDKQALGRAVKRLGRGKVVTTPGLMLMAIRHGLLTVGDADALKAILETHRFKMKFGSFAELLVAKP